MNIRDFILTTINERTLYPTHKRLGAIGTLAAWQRHVTGPALRSYLKTGPDDRALSSIEAREIAIELREYYVQHVAED